MLAQKMLVVISLLCSIFAEAKAVNSILNKIDDISLSEYSSLSSDSGIVKVDYAKFKASRFIAPATLLAVGAIVYAIPSERIDEAFKYNEADKWNTSLENVTMFTPLIAVYGLDWCGIEARNNLKDRFIVTLSSYGIGQGIAQLLKVVADRERPNQSDRKSFLSAHSTTAFIGAHLLMKEYNHISLWISVSGYAFATFTGYARIAKNKHWVSDVVAGAGLGILSVELSYLLLPHLSKIFTFGKEQEKKLAITPSLSTHYAGIGFHYTF